MKPPMNADERRTELDKLTRKIIGCIYRVSNALGAGFLEKVYENALAHEIRKAGLKVKQQYAMVVRDDGIVVGDFTADLLVDDQILIELKAIEGLDGAHTAQCLNYLAATGHSVCLLVNFGRPKVQIKTYCSRVLKCQNLRLSAFIGG